MGWSGVVGLVWMMGVLARSLAHSLVEGGGDYGFCVETVVMFRWRSDKRSCVRYITERILGRFSMGWIDSYCQKALGRSRVK